MRLELWQGETAELKKETVQKNALINNYYRTGAVGLEITVPCPLLFVVFFLFSLARYPGLSKRVQHI